MSAEKKRLFLECVTAAAAVGLWHLTFSLLGLPEPMSHGIKLGSVIVLAGCFALCRGLVYLASHLVAPMCDEPIDRESLAFDNRESTPRELHVRDLRGRSARFRSQLPPSLDN